MLSVLFQATPERKEKKYSELDQLEAELLAARYELQSVAIISKYDHDH